MARIPIQACFSEYITFRLGLSARVENRAQSTLPLCATDSAEGFLGVDATQNCKIMTVGYFRSVDDVLRYSKGPLHSKAYADYHKHSDAENLYYEIYHELVEVRQGRNEAIYANCRPHGLAAAWVKKTVEEKGEEHERWESIMSPATGSIRTSMQRMGRA